NTSASRTSVWRATSASASSLARASSSTVLIVCSVPGRRRRVPSLDGGALVHPSGKPFLEHAMIPPSELVQNVAGPPGQRVRARSIKDYQPCLGDLGRAVVDDTKRHRAGALDVALYELLPVPDVDDVRLGAAVEQALELVALDEVGGIFGGPRGRGGGEQQPDGPDDGQRAAHLAADHPRTRAHRRAA